MPDMRAYPIALLISAAAVLTACSSGEQKAAAPAPPPASKAPTSSSAPANKASADTCALLPSDDVSQAIKIPGITSKAGPAHDNPGNGGKATSCEYVVEGKTAGALAVTRYEGRQAKPADMIAAIKKAKPGAVDVPGFPDGAVFYTDEQKTATLAAAKVSNGVPVLVNYTGPVKMTKEMMTPLVHTAVAKA
ncbi:DUF3558 family protein [Amycolatopsis echigonensis]|uniref:DUF3558 family protein n=2 Tax=Amycolatopsis echigonensis TaxID=2576905 RepID=A0A2N3WIX1_9PSEU|nr:DUF3558 family protein [Amycolatopsis echigonensis]PKV93811.1 uncharacterized protein DUF3558 [Amycolatopsis niigatensis]